MKRADIEGLRALSIILVFAYHLFPAAVPGGFIGVDVFFVISGFLITQHLFREYHQTGRIKPVAFYGRRIRRLLPASFLVLLVSLALTAFVLPGYETQRFDGGIAASALYVANWFLVLTGTSYTQIGNGPSIIQQFWSLSVEEQFYLIWPLVFLLVAGIVIPLAKKIPNRQGLFVGVLVTIFVASLATSIVQTQTMPKEAFFSTFTRAWEFALGGLIAFLPPSQKYARTGTRRALLIAMSWIAIAAILVAAWKLNDASPFPGAIALWPVAAAAVAIAIGDLGTAGEPAYISKFAPIVLIGGLSYSIYLWHWLVIFLAAKVLGTPFTLKSAIVVIAITLALSLGTKYLIENPLRFGPYLRTTRRSLLFAAIGAAVIVALACTATVRANIRTTEATTHKEPFSSTQQINADIKNLISTDSWTGISRFTPRHTGALWDVWHCFGIKEESFSRCTFGSPSSKHLMVIVGDSFSGMYTPGIIAGFEGSDWRILPLSNGGCPMADFVRGEYQGRSKDFDCFAYQQWRMKMLTELKPEVIVVAHATASTLDPKRTNPLKSYPLTLWISELTSALTKLKTITPSIVVIGQPPYSSNCNVNMTPSTCPSAEMNFSLVETEKPAVTTAGLTYIDTSTWFCDESLAICPEAIDGTYVHQSPEDKHLSNEYSVRLSKLLHDAIQSGIKE